MTTSERAPRFFVCGYAHVVREWIDAEMVARRPLGRSAFIACHSPGDVRGHVLRRHDQVIRLHGSDPETLRELRWLEVIRDQAIASLESYRRVLGRTRFWQLRERRRLRRQIERYERELG